MSQLVARLILAMLLLPVVGTVIVLYAVFVFGRSGPTVLTLIVLWAIVYTVVCVYWGLLWRDLVRWTPRRRMMTILLVPGASLLAVASGIVASVQTTEHIAGIMVGGGVGVVAGVFGSVLIWRETRAERVARLTAASGSVVACPLCGYNLTGLRESRCPECGARFTLDELYTAQTRVDLHELSDSSPPV